MKVTQKRRCSYILVSHVSTLSLFLSPQHHSHRHQRRRRRSLLTQTHTQLPLHHAATTKTHPLQVSPTSTADCRLTPHSVHVAHWSPQKPHTQRSASPPLPGERTGGAKLHASAPARLQSLPRKKVHCSSQNGVVPSVRSVLSVNYAHDDVMCEL